MKRILAIMVASTFSVSAAFADTTVAKTEVDGVIIQETRGEMGALVTTPEVEPATATTTVIATPDSVSSNTVVETADYAEYFDSRGAPTWYDSYTFKLD